MTNYTYRWCVLYATEVFALILRGSRLIRRIFGAMKHCVGLAGSFSFFFSFYCIWSAVKRIKGSASSLTFLSSRYVQAWWWVRKETARDFRFGPTASTVEPVHIDFQWKITEKKNYNILCSYDVLMVEERLSSPSSQKYKFENWFS